MNWNGFWSRKHLSDPKTWATVIAEAFLNQARMGAMSNADCGRGIELKPMNHFEWRFRVAVFLARLQINTPRKGRV
jgi:hypothetical protein